MVRPYKQEEDLEIQGPTLDDKTRDNLRLVGQKTQSTWQHIGNAFRAVAGFRMYVSVPPGAKKVWGEMWTGKKDEPRRKAQPTGFQFKSFREQQTNFSGWLGSGKASKASKRRKR